MNIPAKLVGVLFIALSMTMGGCATGARTAGDAGGVTYAYGSAETIVEASPQRVLHAAERVLREMQVEGAEPEHREGAGEWVMRGRAEDGQPVRITIRQLGPEASKVWVRAGVLTDRDLSVTVLQRIRAML